MTAIKRKVHKMIKNIGSPICLCNYKPCTAIRFASVDTTKVTCSDCLKEMACLK